MVVGGMGWVVICLRKEWLGKAQSHGKASAVVLARPFLIFL